jgi:hypothetical protein
VAQPGGAAKVQVALRQGRPHRQSKLRPILNSRRAAASTEVVELAAAAWASLIAEPMPATLVAAVAIACGCVNTYVIPVGPLFPFFFQRQDDPLIGSDLGLHVVDKRFFRFFEVSL